MSGWSSLPRRTVKEISMRVPGRKWLDQLTNSHLTFLLPSTVHARCLPPLPVCDLA